jgi:capsular polysaccharide transport system permease protein
LVSSSFLRHYDETKTLLKSQHQICTIGADGENLNFFLALFKLGIYAASMIGSLHWTKLTAANRWFIVLVILPTLLTGIYFFFVASGQYQSESRFVIKAPNQRSGQISSFANLIQTTGLSAGQEQAEQVIDFVRSRSALKKLSDVVSIKRVYSAAGVDAFSRFPAPWQQVTFEDLYDFYGGKVHISRDKETGLIVLRTLAFSPRDAQAINESLLRQSEELVNELNERARRRNITEAEVRVSEAEQRVAAARRALALYRSKSELIDPMKQAGGMIEIVNRVVTERSALQAQLSTLRRLTPDHPSISALQQQVSSLNDQIDQQTARVVGGRDTVSGKLPAYEALATEQEFAEQLLVVSRNSLEQARADALRQQFYLERVVTPNMPDVPEYPRALRNVLTMLGFALSLYFIAWMLIVGILEHKPEN